MDYEIKEVAADAKDRCQNIIIGSGIQCQNRVMPGTNYCPIHCGVGQSIAHEAVAAKNYRLLKWKTRVAELGDNPNVKNLRDEVAILRLLMEERLNRIDDATDLIMQSGPISDLVLKIEKVVASCHKLEGSMGQLLDKAAILQFASEVITILGEELKGQEAVVSKIADRITTVIGTIGKKEE